MTNGDVKSNPWVIFHRTRIVMLKATLGFIFHYGDAISNPLVIFHKTRPPSFTSFLSALHYGASVS